MAAHTLTAHQVTVIDRPTDLAPLPDGCNPAYARLSEAKDVVEGDWVLGYVFELPGGRQVVDYHTDAYQAAPVPNVPKCGCPGHQALEDEDKTKPLTVLTDGYPWDCCDVMPSDALVLIVPAAKLPPAKKKESNRPMSFTHNGVDCTVHRTPGTADRWSVKTGGMPIVTRRRDPETAIRDAKAVLDGDDSKVTGFDTLARLLVL